MEDLGRVVEATGGSLVRQRERGATIEAEEQISQRHRERGILRERCTLGFGGIDVKSGGND